MRRLVKAGYNHRMDEITLGGLLFFGTHGVNPEETALGQRFGVDDAPRLGGTVIPRRVKCWGELHSVKSS